MKICVVSDSHDRAGMLARAVEAGIARGARVVVHCGDLIGANTLQPLLKLGVPVHVVHGNNLGDPVTLVRLCAGSGGVLHYHGQDGRLELAGRRIFFTHYPHYGHAMACTGDWDLVCCGHDHRASAARVHNVKGGETWLVNPGSCAGLGAPAATYAMGDLDRMAFETHVLDMDLARAG